ncbi:MAG: T9SS type A sorting domain-containing protein [Candidatus Latescibacteria bacterium]|nr:T9SS type A sorting domain-containing protein [Candidatus Latescibacterota bacterium]
MAQVTISPSGQGSVNGMYHVRVINPTTKEQVGFWPSIPINGGRRIGLTLEVGGPATLASAEEGGGGNDLALNQNYPNPFNPETAIRYELPRATNVRMTIYNAQGQAVRTLVDGPRPAGAQAVRWDGRDDRGRGVASGIYYYRLEAAGFSETQKMLLLK